MVISTGPNSVVKCVNALDKGGLIGLPTETVYGLAADATQDQAVASIFEAKGRPQFNPLILHSYSIETLEEYAEFNDRARILAAEFWPGPLTLVLPRRINSSLSLLVSAGLDTVAVRIPRHPMALELLYAYGRPLAAPSANLSGKLSPTCAEAVEENLGDKVRYILDGGPCQVGLESTIVDLTTDRTTLFRHGGISAEEIETKVGPVSSYKGTGIKSPGMLKSHYAPSIPVRMDTESARDGEAFLSFGPDCDGTTLNLSPSGNLKEAAANLFAMMRKLDSGVYSGIAIAPIPMEGLGLAINDRIRRATKG